MIFYPKLLTVHAKKRFKNNLSFNPEKEKTSLFGYLSFIDNLSFCLVPSIGINSIYIIEGILCCAKSIKTIELYDMSTILMPDSAKSGKIVISEELNRDKQAHYKTKVSSLKYKEMKSVIEIINNKIFSNVQISKDSPNEK
ncbi:14040_t:CDS:2, partial [Racocetra fulgida]